MNKTIFSHFHPDEREFVERAAEWIENAARYHEQKLTDFLDPRQAYILSTLAAREPDVQIRLEGGSEHAERRRALIAPDYADLSQEDMQLTVLEITPEGQRFTELEHGDYMGSLLGLGMKRDKIGDIHVLDDGCHTVVATEIASYLNLNMNQVHRLHVMTSLLPIEQLRAAEQELQTMDLSVASMRLDGIASDVYRLSRSKILVPIKAGRCKVNWKPEEDPSHALKEGDVVSVQGMGRFKVLELEGITKKGRYRVKIGKFV
ncbi:YlmH family RNA-binding protein [Paenibacillus hunanensis]|uniref:RNA-binding protein YlmH n=1 Tax=Paenibacillus hunanensis TaxID=539262 RepID=A0ABU1J568_9BACL|nr:YlmH/Sll1252 family protein [Paenibacillus hunanensis]MDR6245727.1 RNA-binding protein YlmH [Paenibacillus hunanensis]GGJ19845.1 RNA-binding protein S4 [Paenibacillus hunanensis]